jgi:predicted amidohydrolase
MRDIRIAAAVCRSLVHRADENLARMRFFSRRAAEEGARLVCFPEMNVTGYSSREDILPAAQPVSSPAVEQVVSMAEEENVAVLAGIAEKGGDGRIFASHLVVKPGGSVEIYRKIHIAPPEKDLLTAGDQVPVFEIDGVKFGIQLCYDVHFPELSSCMAAKGVDAIFIPHASPRGMPEEKFDSWMRHLPARAFDNGVFVVACNQAGNNGNGLDFPGLALALGPSGQIIEKDVSGEEGLLLADLKASDLEAVRGHRMRYFFPNRRPEIYNP